MYKHPRLSARSPKAVLCRSVWRKPLRFYRASFGLKFISWFPLTMNWFETTKANMLATKNTIPMTICNSLNRSKVACYNVARAPTDRFRTHSRRVTNGKRCKRSLKVLKLTIWTNCAHITLVRIYDYNDVGLYHCNAVFFVFHAMLTSVGGGRAARRGGREGGTWTSTQELCSLKPLFLWASWG